MGLPIDPLAEALQEERDAAQEEANFERHRAKLATERLDALQAENARLRRQVRELIQAEGAEGARATAAETALAQRRQQRDPTELEQRLRLALDTSRKLERERGVLHQKLAEARSEADRALADVQRLHTRLRATEGELKLLRPLVRGRTH